VFVAAQIDASGGEGGRGSEILAGLGAPGFLESIVIRLSDDGDPLRSGQVDPAIGKRWGGFELDIGFMRPKVLSR